MNDVRWWIGTVENVDDKERRGRIQVRIFGIHTSETAKNEDCGVGIPTEELPWAMPVMPLIYGGIASSTVPPPGVQPGAWVTGISLDGDVYNKLLVLGIISIAMNASAINPNDSDMGALTNLKAADIKSDLSFDPNELCLTNAGNIIEQLESGGNDNAYNPNSKSGAHGPMQLIGSYIIDHFNSTKASNPEALANFERTTGIKLASSNVTQLAKTNPTLNRILGRGYYKHILENSANGDYVLASFAYCEGPGALKKAMAEFGTPPHDISYEDFAKATAAKYPTGSQRIGKFMQAFGTEGKASCIDLGGK